MNDVSTVRQWPDPPVVLTRNGRHNQQAASKKEKETKTHEQTR